MKHTKLMLSALVAVMALVSCNKEETIPVEDRLKTVEVSLENVIMTRSESVNIEHGTKVAVNKFKLFLTDASGNLYVGKDAAGNDIVPVFDGTDMSKEITFHFVDPKCTKVIAVANFAGDDIALSDLDGNLQIDAQQDAGNLTLYAEAVLVRDAGGKVHNDTSGEVTYESPVYVADLQLAPRVARFEVNGFSVGFDAENPEFQKIEFMQIAFQNYYPATRLDTGAESGGLVNHMTDLNHQGNTFTWLNDTEKPAAWYWDNIDVVCTPDAPTASNASNLAYHMFANAAAPTLVIKLLADDQPAYLWSKSIRDKDGNEITDFKEGYIYRMDAGTVTGKGDGNIPVDPGDIDPVDRCLEITVEVIPWTVVLVYPEF